MTVRARLKVGSILENKDGEGKVMSKQITFGAVYSADPASPNYSFSQATPNAQLTMTITNPAAYETFLEGGEYDVDFTLVGEPQPSVAA